MQYEKFRVHSTDGKCVSLPLNHELDVSNPFNIQTECSSGCAVCWSSFRFSRQLHVKFIALGMKVFSDQLSERSYYFTARIVHIHFCRKQETYFYIN